MNQPYTITDFGPSDLLTSAVIGERRVKVAVGDSSLGNGDYLVVTCNAATATADCVIEWGESV